MRTVIITEQLARLLDSCPGCGRAKRRGELTCIVCADHRSYHGQDFESWQSALPGCQPIEHWLYRVKWGFDPIPQPVAVSVRRVEVPELIEPEDLQ